jgi:hypothetical protein
MAVMVVAAAAARSGTNLGILIFSARHRIPEIQEIPVFLQLVLRRPVQVLADDLTP